MADTQLAFGRAEDFVMVPKPKKGVAFVEARFKNDRVLAHTDKGCQQLLAQLQRALSSEKLGEDTVISLETDLLQNSILNDVPREMFDSLRVVEIQGLDPSVRRIPAGDVAIKINLLGVNMESPTVEDEAFVAVLPTSKLDGLWEL